MNYKRFIIYHLTFSVALLCALSACSDDVTGFFGDSLFKDGEPVAFTTYVPAGAKTRSAKTVYQEGIKAAYKAVAKDYNFTVEMYHKTGEPAVDTKLGEGTYVPGKDANEAYYEDGTLTPTTALYWPNSTTQYAFKATAGTTTLEADQSTPEKWLAQDRLEGFAFTPDWTGGDDDGHATDKIDELNYHTLKEWYDANRNTAGLPSPVGGVAKADFYKKIPLYMQHERALITIKLKAGEGVKREDLEYAKAVENIHTAIFSYSTEDDSKKDSIITFAQEATVNYENEDANGPAKDGVATSQFSAVVMPFNYKEVAETKRIAEIHLSGQRFTFYASNDNNWSNEEQQNKYNLEAGQHLVITATLGRDSRKILITAYVEDWDETVTSTVVDDYGQAGNPVAINTRDELYAFLSDRKQNRAGNVAIIVPNSLNLEWSEGKNDKTGGEEPWNYPELELYATLNLAGATLRTDHQLFNTIRPVGSIINGAITVGTDKDDETTVSSVVAKYNYGTVERITVSPKDVDGNTSKGKASVAGLVENNSGHITNCTSTLPVYGTSGIIGGIAARSVYSAENNNSMPVIDGCTVNARIDGATGVTGAGIVGEAAGRVSNNTFVYGITISQNTSNFKNTIHHKVDNDAATPVLRAYGNAWPTYAHANGTGIPSTNVNATPFAERHYAVIDCQEELEMLLTDTYNQKTKKVEENGEEVNINVKYRLSADFAVSKSTWKHGKSTDNTTSDEAHKDGNVNFELNGNNHTITTDAMLFSNIKNTVKDLTIRLSDNMLANANESTGGVPTGDEAIAPLAYAVVGSEGKLSNIRVKAGNYRIQGGTVGGIVVWAYDGATIEDCQCKATILARPPESLAVENYRYYGGIVACAAEATIDRCTFHNTGETLYYNSNADYTQVTQSDVYGLNLFFGGILGGTAPKVINNISEDPSVLITDCTSWFSTNGHEKKGAVVGYAQYGSNTLSNGLQIGESGCKGNYWRIVNEGIPAFGRYSGRNVESLLGKRNAVTPLQDNTYDE